MKVLKADTDFVIFNKLFRHMKANHFPLLIWQTIDERRTISDSYLNSFHYESQQLHFENHPDVNFDPDSPVFCYSEDAQLIFKTTIREINDYYISLRMPEEMQLMGEKEQETIEKKTGINISTIWMVKRLNVEKLEDLPDYMRIKSMSERSRRDKHLLSAEIDGLNMDEEDKLFATRRESPRARPKSEKMIKVKLPDKKDTYHLKLFDLSQGGVGFISHQLEYFPKGTKLIILGFDNFELDDPLIGEIKSHRPIDELNNEWKIGVMFDEGQS
jgi:hypothetical protein